MADTYYMSNRKFEAEIQNGTLRSLKHREDVEKTEYILPGTAFGDVVLTYKTEGNELTHWFCNRASEYQDNEPVRKYLNLMYEGKVVDEKKSLCVSNQILLKADRLEQITMVKNISEQAITIMDAGFAMAPNSQVNWGESAGKKVIGHPFVSGHGSHSLITRCDGTGKYLLILPYKGGKWEYFDQGVDLPKVVEGKDQRQCLFVYEHSEFVASKAKEHGARLRQQSTHRVLLPQEEIQIGNVYQWVDSYDEAREKYIAYGIPDVIAVPGYTVCKGKSVRVCIRGNYNHYIMKPTHEERTHYSLLWKNEDFLVYDFLFEQLGENQVQILYGEDSYVNIDFFVTQSIGTMMNKRGAFIANHQIKNHDLWYDGLLAEWNNETGMLLTPDNYDNIKGWRIYEVTCDDPGLSKPAFLSSKLAESPMQDEVEALDYYIQHFVWGGLQCKEEDEYPYGIYGIPDWYQNRNSKDNGNGGKEHLWRIYDYPHIMLMYYNMYRIARDYETVNTRLSSEEYLNRAYRTAHALFTIPLELEEWSAYKTGLYNEVVIEDIIRALRAENCTTKADHLERHWLRKIKYFVIKSKTLFESEYPFDTTGFESTHVIAKTALSLAELKKREDRWNPPMSYVDAVRFMENQTDCNIACRGYLEPAYYWYGSDYRANNYHYTLSYMSQMGGCSLLDYALYYDENPYPLLRLAYGSLLSSWSLMNCGDEEDDYGYWFPGKQHDGAASGGFEPLPYGMTWLEQPHTSGPWFYSCEIDLGFCGALRGAATILVVDPIFGLFTYGGTLQKEGNQLKILCEDGVGKRFHVVRQEGKLHVTIDKGRFDEVEPILIKEDYTEYRFVIDTSKLKKGKFALNFTVESSHEMPYLLIVDGESKREVKRDEKIEEKIEVAKDQMLIQLVKH